MKICVLASGSEGNVTYVESGKEKILIDLGKNVKYIKEKLNNINVDINDITSVIISHTHSDHISALNTFCKNYNAKIYITEKMLPELRKYGEITNINYFDENITFSNTLVEIIKSSHDSIDSRNFIFVEDGKRVCYITDTGYINRKYFEQLKNLDLYLFESNHDVEMLMKGPYPQWLKKRVVGTYGHLSNRDASVYLAKFIGDKTQKIYLMHLSKTNNTPDKALETINEVFCEYGIPFTNISCATQNQETEVVEI